MLGSSRRVTSTGWCGGKASERMDGVGVDKEEAGHWKQRQEVASRSSEVWVGLGVLEPEQKETWLEEKASCDHCYRHWHQGTIWSTIKELGRAGSRAPHELVSRIDAMLSKAVWVRLSSENQEIWAHLCSPPHLCLLERDGKISSPHEQSSHHIPSRRCGDESQCLHLLCDVQVVKIGIFPSV